MQVPDRKGEDVISKARRIIKNAVRHIQKKVGLHVFRPVENAQKWADWLQASGVPNPVSADQMRVTIMTVVGDIQIIPETYSYVVRSTSGVFCRIGEKLCFAWYDYGYYDRHWSIREISGCEVCCVSRAVLVLSENPGDFEFTDDALLRAPVSLVLGGEATEGLDDAAVEVTKSAGADLYTPSAEVVVAATALLKKSFDDAEADPMQQAALDDLARGKPVQKSQILDDLGEDMAADVGILTRTRPKAQTTPAPEPKPAPATEDKTKGREVRKVKSDDERQVIYVWASVSSRDGEEVIDFHGDAITNEALHDICTHVVKGARASAFEHDGDFVNETVAAFVLDRDMQKALSAFSTNGDIELDREGVIVGIHIPDKDVWNEVKDEDWEASINATAFVEPIEQKEAA